MAYFSGDIKKLNEVTTKLDEIVSIFENCEPGQYDLAKLSARARLAEAKRLLDQIDI